MDSDPWNWSVQDVQQFFQNDAARYISDLPHGRLPQLESFLSALNDNEVTGATLLTSIDSNTLRDDCGVTKLGERSAVQHCITKLRRQSTIHIGQKNPFGLQTPPQLALPALPPVPPLTTSPTPSAAQPVQDVQLSGDRVRQGEVRVEDSRGRKRRKLNLSEGTPNAKRLLVDLTVSTARTEYLGHRKFPIDELFYDQTRWGAEVADLQPPGNVVVFYTHRADGTQNDNFQFHEQNKCVGESTYVYSKLRHLMNRVSEIEDADEELTLWRGGRKALGVVPYRSTSDLPTRSATVVQFRNNDDEPVAVRENAAYLVSGFQLDQPVQQAPGEHDHLLEKWKPSEDLPLYGDAEEDLEDYIDDETEHASSAGDALPEAEEEADEAIDDANLTRQRAIELVEEVIAECIDLWKERLPHLEQKRAWSVWKKTKQSRSVRDALIQGAEALIEHLSKRLQKSKDELISNAWHSEEKLREACAAMEPTIEDREEQRWKIEVWRRRQELPHVVRHSTLAKKYTPSTLETANGNMSIAVPSRDRLSVSPPPVTADVASGSPREEMEVDMPNDDGDNLVEEEIQYDADDEVYHTPGHTPASSPQLSPFIVRTPDGSDLDVSGLENGESGTEYPPEDTAATPSNLEPTTSNNDETYEPNNEESESDLPSPSTWIPRKTRTPVKSKTSPVELTGSLVSQTPTKSAKTEAKKPMALTGDPVTATASQVDSWDYLTLARSNDRLRMLIKRLRDAGPKVRDRLDKVLRTHRHEFETQLQAAVQSRRKGSMDANLNKDIAEIMMRVADFYIPFIIPHVEEQGIPLLDKDQWSSILSIGQYKLFTNALSSILLKKESKLFITPQPTPIKPGSSSAPIQISSESSDHRPKQPTSPLKRRKKRVRKDAAAQDSRVMALNRQRRFQESQTTSSTKLAAMIASDPSYSGIEINPAKKGEDDFIYIYDKIARQMKPHQIDGARFLWREITAEGDEDAQGCVLAHTMGLGKTMQTIALLAAVNEAAASDTASVYNQLPAHLRSKEVRSGRQLRTLVLCPPALVQNWRKEIDRWAPGKLGNVFILDTNNQTANLDLLQTWTRVGGVLLIGYQRFRSMLNRKKDQNKSALDENKPIFEEMLLRNSEIVVADEAHNLKNDKSAISVLTSRFSTESRIALTGTPMSNDVDEIYTIVSWAAPGFLADKQEFKTRFADPIKNGLYQDSNSYQKRMSVKKLKVLQAEIQPKVDRANYEALRGSLKAKTEFLITVPLTPVQMKLYRKYIQALRSEDRSENASQVTMFGWLARLTLLTNHPNCFRNKLLDPPPMSKKQSKESKDFETTSRDPTPGTTTESGSATPVYAGENDTSEILPEEETVIDDPVNEPVPALDKDEISDILEGFEDDKNPQLSAKVAVFLNLLSYSFDCRDKVLVFSGTISTLDYLKDLLTSLGKSFGRIDGTTLVGKRKDILEEFHNGGYDIMLISTKAGGVGLNIQRANRVFIFDSGFNPMNEEQAIGRAYRLGQQKPVFVYRFVAGGTFEENIYNKQLFKLSLTARVVDKKAPNRVANRNTRDYLYEPKDVAQEDILNEAEKDPKVLGRLLEQHGPGQEGKLDTMIRAIKTMETLQEEVPDLPLNEEEQKEVNQEIQQSRLRQKGKKGAVLDTMPPPATAPQISRGPGIGRFPPPTQMQQLASTTMNGSTTSTGFTPRPYMQPQPSTAGNATPWGHVQPQPPNNNNNNNNFN